MSVGNIYARGMVPHTCIAMASTVRLFSQSATTGAYNQIGVVQSFKPTDTRRMERARGVGFGDRVAEIVPGMTEVAITCTRMCLYSQNILDTLGYFTNFNNGGNQGAVRSLSHMKNPFDMNEVIVFHAGYGGINTHTNIGPGAAALAGFGTPGGGLSGVNQPHGQPPTAYTSFWYHNCWVNNWARTIEVTGNLIYMEDVGIDVTWVSDGLEPAPYADTDIWDTAGIGCNNQVFLADTKAITDPPPGGIQGFGTYSYASGNGNNVTNFGGGSTSFGGIVTG